MTQPFERLHDAAVQVQRSGRGRNNTRLRVRFHDEAQQLYREGSIGLFEYALLRAALRVRPDRSVKPLGWPSAGPDAAMV